MKEEWVFIEATDGLYEVSNLGRVRKEGSIVDLEIYNGYAKVGITTIYGTFRMWLHRIVATHFCTKPEGKNFVNHIDGNKLNNTSTNLEWVTNSENQRHRIDVLGKGNKGSDNPMFGRSGILFPAFKGCIYQIDPKTNTIIEKFEGSCDIQRKHPEFKYRSVNRCLNGYLKTYKGFIWTRNMSGCKTS